ncbi:MAG TPA: hypothetical protein VIG37_28355, partial [Methylomirabilota bacterium]
MTPKRTATRKKPAPKPNASKPPKRQAAKSTLSPQGRGQGEGTQGDGLRAITVWQNRVPLRVHVKGTGPAVVYFHGPWGLTWGPFLDALARRFTVYAPEHPGTAAGEPDAIQHVDNLWDLVLCYDELLADLGLREV